MDYTKFTESQIIWEGTSGDCLVQTLQLKQSELQQVVQNCVQLDFE